MSKPRTLSLETAGASAPPLESSGHLELLSAAAVAMAGSFDIRDILETTHRAAKHLLSGLPVDVLYSGRASIGSRTLWFPSEPGEGNLSSADRLGLRDRFDKLRGAGDAGGVESILERELRGSGRSAIPFLYQEEFLGALFFVLPDPTGAERAKLLGILAQHAVTALRNIHLTQERIHFERLSAIGRMIGSIAHDLRGPLTALRGYAGMMATLELEEKQRRDYGRFMLEECDRLNHMVSELLEFTRSGRTEPATQNLSLPDFLGGFAERLDRHYRGRGIRVDLTSGYEGEVLADRSRLERALWNVATNACQAMPGGGRLKLRSRDREGAAILEIEDEGSGIPEDVRHRVFEPFFSCRKSQGIGLGLATARKIVEEHGGTIEIASAPSKGTLVRIALPLPARGESESEARELGQELLVEPVEGPVRHGQDDVARSRSRR
jgi:signal transduction histidine kinase